MPKINESAEQRRTRIKKEKPGWFAKWSLFFFKNKRFTAVLMIALLSFGALSYTTLLTREGFPSVDIPFSFATGTYFVDDATAVDRDVTKPLSEVISEVEGVESVTAFADANFFQVIASLESGMSNVTGNERIKEAIDASGVLPANVQIDFPVFDAARYLGEFDVLVSLYGPQETTDPALLEAEAKTVAVALAESPEIVIAEPQELFSMGVNPFTQEEVTNQTSFGRIGLETEDGFEFYNSTLIGISGEASENLDIFELTEAVNNRISEIELPEGLGLTISAEDTELVNNQISSLQNNVLTGLIAVTIISALMISWRVSVLTAVFMVSVILVTSILLLISGHSLNTLTLFALVLALGLFVDDATIISESIDANKDKKLSRKDIVKHAINNVGSATFAGTLTTVLVFVPLMFIGGILGSFIFLLPLTIVLALVTSLILSLTLLPFLAQFSILSSKNIDRKPWANPVPIWLSGMIRKSHTNKKVGIPWGVAMLTLSIVFIMGSGYFFSKLSFNIFPPSKDSDQLGVAISYNPGTTIDQAEAIADQADEIVYKVVGENLEKTAFGANGKPSTRSADIWIVLKPFRERDIKAPVLVEELGKELESLSDVANFQVNQYDAGPPGAEYPFLMQIFNEDVSVAEAAAIDVQVFLSDRDVELPNGTTTKIIDTTISNVKTVVRKDGRRYVEVAAAYDSDDVSAVVQSTRELVEENYGTERLAQLGLSEDALEFDFGQESENEESFDSLGPAFLIAISTMFVLLAIQFRSVLKPLLIFLALPFSVLGVSMGLYYSGNALSFFAMIGFIGLIGIAVNNTILLVDAANQERRWGKSTVDAIAEASRRRFRPLFTTTATTIAALTPLALSDPFWEPLAVTIMFGLLSSTILVILSFPYYYILADMLASGTKKLVKWLFGVIFKRNTSRA